MEGVVRGKQTIVDKELKERKSKFQVILQKTRTPLLYDSPPCEGSKLSNTNLVTWSSFRVLGFTKPIVLRSETP